MADQDDIFSSLSNDKLVELPNIGGSTSLVNSASIIPQNTLVHQHDDDVPDTLPREAAEKQPTEQPQGLNPNTRRGRTVRKRYKYRSLAKDIHPRTVRVGPQQGQGPHAVEEDGDDDDNDDDDEDEDGDDEDVLPAEMHNAADVLPNLIHQLQQQLEHPHPADEDLLFLNQLDAGHVLPDEINQVQDAGDVLPAEINQLQPHAEHPQPADEDLLFLNQLDAGHVLPYEINQVHDAGDVLPVEINQLQPQYDPLVNQLDAGDVVPAEINQLPTPPGT